MKQGSTKGNNDNNNIKSLQPSFTEQTPEEILDSTYKQLQSNLSEEILEKVLQQSPQFFERLVVDLLVKWDMELVKSLEELETVELTESLTKINWD